MPHLKTKPVNIIIFSSFILVLVVLFVYVNWFTPPEKSAYVEVPEGDDIEQSCNIRSTTNPAYKICAKASELDCTAKLSKKGQITLDIYNTSDTNIQVSSVNVGNKDEQFCLTPNTSWGGFGRSDINAGETKAYYCDLEEIPQKNYMYDDNILLNLYIEEEFCFAGGNITTFIDE